MPIGKSKISDMDFGSFENTIDKNIETDKASDKFDQQLQAYKLSNETGFCHNGFEIVKENTTESVEQELYDFLNDKMITGDIPDVKGIRIFKDNLPTSDNGIIIDCADGRQIKLTIQIG